MQKKLFSVFGVVLFCCSVHAQTLAERPFVLKGHLSGPYAGWLYLNYQPGNGKMGVIDSCKVKDGDFVFKGLLAEPNKASLATFNLFSDRPVVDGKNIAPFYIEASRMRMSVTLNDFAHLRLSGSATDSDRVRLNKQEEALQTLMASLSAAPPASRKVKTIDSLQSCVWSIDSAFIVQHPKSFLSVSMLAYSSYYIYHISVPMLAKLYSQFPKKWQEGQPGRQIKSQIDKEKRVFRGGPAYEFEARTYAGDTLSLDRFRGKKYVLLDFWASWCVPCRALTPQLEKWYDRYNKDLEIISISLGDKREDWAKAIAEDKMKWAQVPGNDTASIFIPKGQAIPDLYEVDLIPSLILIDKDSKIIEKFGGWYDGKSTVDLDKTLRGVLKE